MTLLNTFKAGVMALAIAGTAFAAVPAQAAPQSYFSLNLLGGNGNGGIVLHFGDEDYFDFCLTNKQVLKALANKGYTKVKIVKESNKTDKVWTIGRKAGQWYQMRVDRCTGKVDQVKKIYPQGGNNGLNFNLTFAF